MKKGLTLLLVLVLALAMALPAFADDNRNQIAQVLEMTEGAEELNVLNMYYLTDEEMMDIVKEFRQDEESQELLPKSVKFEHLTMLRQRDVIAPDGESVKLSLRAWGAGEERYLFVFFKPVPEEEDELTDWVVLTVAKGEFIEAELPGSGQYALAWSW